MEYKEESGGMRNGKKTMPRTVQCFRLIRESVGGELRKVDVLLSCNMRAEINRAGPEQMALIL